ncbi:Transcription factor Ken [Orchesella cincta]|uniref:Transcription factor Ken n=1 Tax=Orchesella cincta TaxID=48709 RepID=A0A1D2MXN5_ORCCI|nr:Transcription factor Ken [Orchesella cincta]
MERSASRPLDNHEQSTRLDSFREVFIVEVEDDSKQEGRASNQNCQSEPMEVDKVLQEKEAEKIQNQDALTDDSDDDDKLYIDIPNDSSGPASDPDQVNAGLDEDTHGKGDRMVVQYINNGESTQHQESASFGAVNGQSLMIMGDVCNVVFADQDHSSIFIHKEANHQHQRDISGCEETRLLLKVTSKGEKNVAIEAGKVTGVDTEPEKEQVVPLFPKKEEANFKVPEKVVVGKLLYTGIKILWMLSCELATEYLECGVCFHRVDIEERAKSCGMGVAYDKMKFHLLTIHGGEIEKRNRGPPANRGYTCAICAVEFADSKSLTKHKGRHQISGFLLQEGIKYRKSQEMVLTATKYPNLGDQE